MSQRRRRRRAPRRTSCRHRKSAAVATARREVARCEVCSCEAQRPALRALRRFRAARRCRAVFAFTAASPPRPHQCHVKMSAREVTRLRPIFPPSANTAGLARRALERPPNGLHVHRRLPPPSHPSSTPSATSPIPPPGAASPPSTPPRHPSASTSTPRAPSRPTGKTTGRRRRSGARSATATGRPSTRRPASSQR